MSDLSDKLGTAMVRRSTDFVGLVETKSNAVWDNPATPQWEKDKSDWLRSWMRKVSGWTPGAPYCVAFDGAIAAACLEELGISSKPFLSKWTAHVMTNVNMLKKARLHSVSPSVGAVWLAQFGETSSGHAGIVAITGARITTVEANTVAQAVPAGNANLQRAGDGIWIRSFPVGGRGKLLTRAFCSPDAILTLSNVRQ
jgi:hypothetical protein